MCHRILAGNPRAWHNHRLMLCKLRLKFSQSNTHSILAYSLLPFTVKQARKHSSYPCRACWPHTTTSYWGCGAQLGSPQRLPQHYGTGSAEATSKATQTLDLRGRRFRIKYVQRLLPIASCHGKSSAATVPPGHPTSQLPRGVLH